MKCITEKIEDNLYKSSIWDFYFKNLSVGILDIESTGLNPGRNKLILGGLIDCRDFTAYQYLAESRADEADVLKEYVAHINSLDMVVTYNGRHFDMPFIAKRWAKHFSDEIVLPYDLDLYLTVNNFSPIKKLVPNLKQKTLENYMGFWMNRTDEISGKESVELYNSYEKTGDSDKEHQILLHNRDDICQLLKLTSVVKKCDLHKAMNKLGFPVGSLVVESAVTEGNFLKIAGRQRLINKNYRGFSFGEFPVESKFDASDRSFAIKVPIIRNQGYGIIDIRAAGLDERAFAKYPGAGSGFLIIEDHSELRFLETNHFVRDYLTLIEHHYL